VASRFSKEFCGSPNKVLANRKKEITLCCLQMSSANSKGFGAFHLKIKGEFKKRITGGPSLNLNLSTILLLDHSNVISLSL
jgi:hypothetical protein